MDEIVEHELLQANSYAPLVRDASGSDLRWNHGGFEPGLVLTQNL